MTALVLPLESPDATLEAAGGKGAGLSALLREGFPVPPGFVVTTDAYRAFVAGAGLEEAVARQAAAAESGPEALQAASAALRAALGAAPFPEALGLEIAAAYAGLAEADEGRPAVAVRSSATAEDLPGASFAGQQDTFLGVRGQAELLDAVRRCWAGLWTSRAMAYRQRLGIGAGGVSMGVVVQRLLAADRAGILFTLDPVTGDDGVVVINAAWGLGDAVVAGRVVPDTVVVEKGTGRIVRRLTADKRVMTVPAAREVQDVEVDAARREAPVLDDAAAAALAGLGEAVERAFGGPQDVEWAWARGGFHLLQARPVTAAGGAVTGDDWPALDERPPQPFDVWTQANVGELWPEPVSPLVASAIPMVIGGAVRSSLRGVDPAYLGRIQWAKRFYGRLYYNEGALKHVLSHRLGLPASMLDRSRGNRMRTPGDHRLRPLRLVASLPILLRLAASQKQTGNATAAFIPLAVAQVAEFLARGTLPESDRDLWNEGQVWLDRTCTGMSLQNEMTGLGLAAIATLESLLVRWFGRRDFTTDLVGGMEDIQAAEMGAALGRLANALREAGLQAAVEADSAAALRRLREDAGAAGARARLEEFLAAHGHRCANEAEWLYPRWHEAPEQVLELAAAYLRSSADPEARARRQRERREAAVAWVEERLGPVRRMLFRRVLARAQHALRLRDNGKSEAIRVTYPARRLTAVLGERWAGRGWLSRPDDIFFVTYPEIERIIQGGSPAAAGLDLHALAAERRRSMAHWRTVRAPEVLDPAGKPLGEPEAAPEGARELHGIAASGGRVRGTARVLHDAQGALRLSRSDILVTRATDVGWTAAFPLIGGLVTEIGGQLSHAAIVAREYGLPAVVDVMGATTLIRDGQTVVLDGGTGMVWLEEDGAVAAEGDGARA